MPLANYRQLRVWQRGIALAKACYTATEAFPPTERFGLSSQIRRAAASISANIAEGYGRGGRGEYIRHVLIARGSVYELDSHIELATQLGFLPRDSFANLRRDITELTAMLTRLALRLQALRLQALPRKGP
jgi:four helix bundle protein